MECENCKYFKSIGDIGECLRFPPRPDGKGAHTVDEQPTVKKSGWCGEYKKGAKK